MAYLYKAVLKPRSNMSIIKNGNVPTGFIFSFDELVSLPLHATAPFDAELYLDISEYKEKFQDIGSIVYRNSFMLNTWLRHEGSRMERYIRTKHQACYPFNQDYSNISLRTSFNETDLTIHPTEQLVRLQFEIEIHAQLLPYFNEPIYGL